MRAILMSGPAGSGKSTWAEKKRAESQAYGGLPYHIVSSDAKRFEMFGKYWLEPADEKKIIPALMEEIRLYSAGGFSVIVDVAICKNKARKKWFNRLRQYYDEIDLVIIDVPVEKALEQNRNRDRHVPEDTIRQMYGFLEEPDEEMKKMFKNIIKVHDQA